MSSDQKVRLTGDSLTTLHLLPVLSNDRTKKIYICSNQINIVQNMYNFLNEVYIYKRR